MKKNDDKVEVDFAIDAKDYEKLQRILSKKKDVSIDDVIKKLLLNGMREYAKKIKEMSCKKNAA
ncbi:MAG: hypothetical protein ACYCSQ_00680 [bacterium]